MAISLVLFMAILLSLVHGVRTLPVYSESAQFKAQVLPGLVRCLVYTPFLIPWSDSICHAELFQSMDHVVHPS